MLRIYEEIGDALWLIRYSYGDWLSQSDDKNDTYKVLYIDDTFAFIESLTSQKCRLIGIEGIAKKEG